MLAAHRSRYTGVPCDEIWAEHQVSSKIGEIMIYTQVRHTIEDT